MSECFLLLLEHDVPKGIHLFQSILCSLNCLLVIDFLGIVFPSKFRIIVVRMFG